MNHNDSSLDIDPQKRSKSQRIMGCNPLHTWSLPWGLHVCFRHICVTHEHVILRLYIYIKSSMQTFTITSKHPHIID